MNNAHGVQVSLETEGENSVLGVPRRVGPFTFTDLNNRLLVVREHPQPLIYHPAEAANPDPGGFLCDEGTAGLTIPEAIPLAKLTFCCQGNGS